MVRSIDIKPDGVVDVTVSLTTPGCPIKGHFQTGVAKAVTGVEGVTARQRRLRRPLRHREGRASSEARPPRRAARGRARRRSQNVICVGSGKGGVGKSSLTVNLARRAGGRGQARRRARRRRLGLLDPAHARPRRRQRPKVNAERKILPLEAHGLKVMSIGFFVKEDEAVVWRGPMLHKALTQFLEDVAWGELDYLLIDLPPGTGDVSMTLAQLLPQAQVRDRHDAAGRRAEGRAPLRRDGRQGQARDRGRDREHVRLHHAVRRALPDLRRGRRPAAGRRARRAAARPGAADDAAARAGRRGHAAGLGRPRRPGRPGHPPGGARADGAVADRAAGRCRTPAPAAAPQPVGMSLPMA